MTWVPVVGVAILVLVGCNSGGMLASAGTVAPAQPTEAPPGKAVPSPEAPSAIPADVLAFKARRDSCDHFRGEEPYDDERARFLAGKLEESCKGTDKALAELRQRYATRADVLEALREYEDIVE